MYAHLGDLLCVQCTRKGSIINDAASRHVNDAGTLLDFAEGIIVEHALHPNRAASMPGARRGVAGGKSEGRHLSHTADNKLKRAAVHQDRAC